MDASGYVYLGSLILFSAVELYTIGRVVYEIFDRRETQTLWAICLTATVAAAIGLGLSNNLGRVLAMNMFSATLLVFCGIYRHLLGKTPEGAAYESAAKYQALMTTMGVFSALSVLETIVYVYWAYSFVDQLIPFYGNQINFLSDAFCLVLSVWLIWFTQREREKYMTQKIETILQQRMNEFQVYE